MKTLFDLREHSSTDLERLEMGLNSGIAEARQHKLLEVEETLISYKLIVTLAKKDAAERESSAWVEKNVKEILNH